MFMFENSVISCLALIFILNNPRTTILHAGVAEKIQQVMYCFMDCQYKPMAWWLR